MRKRLIYIFVILLISLVVISGCEQYIGKKLANLRMQDNNHERIRYNEGWNFTRNGIFFPPSSSWYSMVYADVDKNSNNEIFLTSDDEYKQNSLVYGFSSSGSNLRGWPVIMNSNFSSGVALGNLDNDNNLEVVSSAFNFHTDHESVRVCEEECSDLCRNRYDEEDKIDFCIGIACYSYCLDINTYINSNIYAWDTNGRLLNGWPKSYDNTYNQGNILLSDINGDNKDEIIFYLRSGSYCCNVDSMEELISLQNFSDLNSRRIKIPNKLQVLNSQGENLEGFPIILNYSSSPSSTPYTDLFPKYAIGDLDNDRHQEIVISGFFDSTYYYDREGIHRIGNVIKIVSDNGFIENLNFSFDNQRYLDEHYSYPVLADLDNDGDLEIVLVMYNWLDTSFIIYAFHHNGQLLDGFPFYSNKEESFPNMPDYPFGPRGDIRYQSANPSISDLDKDGRIDIVVSLVVNFGIPVIFAVNNHGNLLDGFPTYNLDLEADNYNSEGYTNFNRLADINGDGYLDILAKCGNGKISYFDYRGNYHDYIVKDEETENFIDYIVTDLMGDGDMEIVCLFYNNESTFYIHSFDLNSTGKIEWGQHMYNPQHTGRYEHIKYNFSCNGTYFMTWYDEDGNRIRQDEYNISEDQCEGFRCLSNNNEISPACYNEEQCREVCTGSNLCLDIDEWQGICEEQEPREEPYCGNGIKEGTERCDGNDWGNVRDCRNLGYDGGILRCIEPDEVRVRGSIPCRFDTSQCYYEERDEEIPEQQVFPGIIEEEFIQEVEEIQPVVEDINLKYLVTDNQVILEWSNIVSENNEISARTVIEVTGNAIKEGNFFSNIINAIKNLFKKKVRGVRLEDNFYRIYKSTDITSPKQELIMEGSKEDFNCDIKCKFNYVEDEEGSYYYSVEVNGNINIIGPIKIVKGVDEKNINKVIKEFNKLEVN